MNARRLQGCFQSGVAWCNEQHIDGSSRADGCVCGIVNGQAVCVVELKFELTLLHIAQFKQEPRFLSRLDASGRCVQKLSIQFQRRAELDLVVAVVHNAGKGLQLSVFILVALNGETDDAEVCSLGFAHG